MKVIASYNTKGGVGKTAIALNLARCAVASGLRTLLWDLDEQGGATTILGHSSEVGPRKGRRTYQLKDHIVASDWPGLDLLPADTLVHFLDRHDRARHLRELVEKLGQSYDRVIVDCPPSYGLLVDQILELADLVVVPIVPSALSIAAYQQLEAYAAKRGGAAEFLPVFSLVDRRRKAHRDAIEAEPIRVAIPYSAAMERMATERRPIAMTTPRSPASGPLEELWHRIESRLGFTERENG